MLSIERNDENNAQPATKPAPKPTLIVPNSPSESLFLELINRMSEIGYLLRNTKSPQLKDQSSLEEIGERLRKIN